MKRLFTLFLVLSLVLLSAGFASAEEDVVLPFPTETEVNTSWGVYSVNIPDPSTILSGGSVRASLYAQDQYRSEDIDGLHIGSSVQVAGEVYRVAELDMRQDGCVAIDGGAGSVPVVFRPHGELYVATRNDFAVGSYVGDYTLMLPLPDQFCFYWMHSDGTIGYYDGDGFADLLAGGSLSMLDRSCAVLSFSGGQPSAVVFADYMVTNPEEILHTAAASKASPGGIPNTPPYTGGGAGSFTLETIMWNGAGLGKCAVPAGYTLSSEVHLDDETTCLGAPLRLSVQVYSPSASSTLGYYSNEVYIERVKGPFRHKEGELDGQLNVFMMHYMNASEFCDWLASRMASGITFWKNEDTSFLDRTIDSQLAQYREIAEPELAKMRVKTNWYDVTTAHRVYTYEYGGATYALCILAKVRAYQMKASSAVVTCWDVPEYYYLNCLLSDYEQIHATDFQVFTANTTISDTFVHLQEDLTEQIKSDIMAGWARAIAASNAYTAAMNALVSQSVESYLNSSNYSYSDRFSDYIFDRNEYTTSDGYTCDISTSYDYVWEGSGGTVYYSNNALDMPSGATRLSPR